MAFKINTMVKLLFFIIEYINLWHMLFQNKINRLIMDQFSKVL